MKYTIQFRDPVKGTFVKGDGRKNQVMVFKVGRKVIATVKGKFNKKKRVSIKKRIKTFITKIRKDRPGTVYGKKIKVKEFRVEIDKINIEEIKFIEKYELKKERDYYRKSFFYDLNGGIINFDNALKMHVLANRQKAIDFKFTWTVEIEIIHTHRTENLTFSRTIPFFIDTKIGINDYKNIIDRIIKDLIGEMELIFESFTRFEISSSRLFIVLRFKK